MTAVSLQKSLLDFFAQQDLNKTYWVAYSGGLDSQVLLALCASLRTQIPIQLHAVHIHHGLSPHADRWAQHCAQYCQAQHISYVEQRITLPAAENNEQSNLEERAREARYAAFTALLQAGDMLLTGHHQDDQAETLLIQLLRGAGPKGLAAMPSLKTFEAHSSQLGRPLLAFSRDLLRQYALEQQLVWIEDESNDNLGLTRNFIRQQLMPMLLTRWPTVANTLARSAAHCSEAQDLLEQYALTLCQASQGASTATLSVKKLLALDTARQKLVLRTWIKQSGHILPNTQKLMSIMETVLTAAWDRQPQVCWKKTILRRYRDDLFLLRDKEGVKKSQEVVDWDFVAPCQLSGGEVLSAELVIGHGLRLSSVTVRYRQGGEVMDLGGSGRRSLKQLFQEWGVPPWLRDSVPLIFVGEQLVQVVGYRCDPRYVVGKGEKGWVVR